MTDEKMRRKLTEILRIVPLSIRNNLLKATEGYIESIQEIVLRNERPVCVYITGEEMYLTQNGCLTRYVDSQPLVVSSTKDVTDCFNVACGYSVYSHLNEIKEGFLTVKGGHRVGISGTAVVASGSIVNIRDISTVSLRMAREVKGCGEEAASLLVKSNGGLLICGSPCSGKTTVLRDVARILSSKHKYRVAVVDTRGEIAATSKGVNQMDLSMCDVLDGYPRVNGIEQAVRTLSPNFVVCDELGNKEDASALMSAVNSGTRFVATVHASDKEELVNRKNINSILDTNAFDNIVFLKGCDTPGEISESCNVRELENV